MRGKIGAVAMAFAALAGCSSGRPATAPPSVALESISVQMNSWGKTLSDWSIGRDGEGRYALARDLIRGDFRDYEVVTKRFPVSPADFARIEALLRPAHRFAGGTIPCRVDLTDGVYGSIAWTESGVRRAVPFDFGCLSRTAEKVYVGLMDAQAHVDRLAEAGEIVDVKQVGEPRG